MEDDRQELLRRLAETERALRAQTEARERLESMVRVLREERAQNARLSTAGHLVEPLTHAINNPLTILHLRTDLLLEEHDLASSIHQHLLVLRDSAQRIAHITRILQRMSRAALASPAPIGVFELLQVATAEVLKQRPSAELSLAPPQRADLPTLDGNLDGLSLAFEQLLLVAADSGPVRVTLAILSDRIRFECATAPLEWLEPVLAESSTGEVEVEDPMSLVSSIERRASALGFAIATAIARDHGGCVRIGNRSPWGTQLIFELPCAWAP